MNTSKKYRINQLKASGGKSVKELARESWNNRHFPIKNPNFEKKEIKNNFQESSLPILNKNQNNLIQSRNSKDEMMNEELGLIQNMWDDLGVTKEYQNQFVKYLKNLNEEEKKEFFEFEKNNLKRLRECLLKLTKEISSREKKIEDLKKFDEILETTYPDETQKINDSILLDIQNTIKNLRVNSVNIVNHTNKIREILTYNSHRGKFNLDKLNPEYLYNKNYLVKMKNDMNFLNNSYLSKYIDMSNREPDPFLTNCSPCMDDNSQRNNKNNHKINIPIGDELMKAIKKAKYSIMEDYMLFTLNKMNNSNNDSLVINPYIISSNQNFHQNNTSEKNTKRGYSAKTRPTNPNKIINEEFINSKDNSYNNMLLKSNKQTNSYYSYNQNNESIKKQKIKIERDDAPNLTREEFFQSLRDLAKQKNNFEEERRQREEEERILKEKEEEEEERRQREEEERILKEKKEKERKQKEEEKRILKEKKEEERKQKEEKRILKEKKEEERRQKEEEEEERRQKEEEERLLKEKEEEERRQKEEEEDNIDDIIDDIMKESENSNDENRKNNENNNEIEEYNEKKEDNYDNEEHLKEVLDAIDKEKKQKKQYLLKSNNNEEDTEIVNQIMINKDDDDGNQFFIKFYTDSITNLVNQLNENNYLSKIPDNIKNIFNISQIQEDILIKGFQPRILISYLKNQNENLITGLCQFTFEDDFNNNNKKIIINHLSSINRDNHNNDWIEQIEAMISFINNNLTFNSLSFILIDLDNENSEGNIKNLFEEKLKFQKKDSENLYNGKKKETFEFIKESEELESMEKIISIDSLSIITLSQNQSIDHYKEMNSDKYINIFSISALLSEKKDDGIQLEKIKENGIILENEQINQNLKKIIHFHRNIEGVNEIENILYKKVDFNLYDILYEIDECDLVLININLQLENKLTSKYNNYYYNRIKSDISVLTEPKTNSKLYIIPTKDESISIIICQLNTYLKEKFLYKSKNIYEIFYSFYSNLIQEIDNKKVIYFPCFDLEGQVSCFGVNSIEKKIMINDAQNNKVFLNTVDELFKAQMNVESDKQNIFSVFPKNNIDDIITNDCFLFGIYNNNIFKTFNIPAIELFVVTNDYWCKI